MYAGVCGKLGRAKCGEGLVDIGLAGAGRTDVEGGTADGDKEVDALLKVEGEARMAVDRPEISPSKSSHSRCPSVDPP